VTPPPATATRQHPALDQTLIVRTRNFVGDVVLALPALERLDQAGYRLHLVGKGWLGNLFAAYDWPVSVYPKRISDRLRLLRSLRPAERRHHSIDAITFATSFSSAVEMRLAGLRPFGYRCEGRSPFLAGGAAIVRGEHALASYWRLVSALLREEKPPPPAATLRLSARAHAAAAAVRQARGIEAGYLVVVPFAGGTFEKIDKRWPGFDVLVPRLLATGRQVVIAPGPGEENEALARFTGASILPGLDLGTYTALMRDAALTIANDTGPGHLVAAAGGALLSVLGPTKVEQWGPLGPRVGIVQSWPEWPSVERVFDAAMARLADRSAGDQASAVINAKWSGYQTDSVAM